MEQKIFLAPGLDERFCFSYVLNLPSSLHVTPYTPGWKQLMADPRFSRSRLLARRPPRSRVRVCRDRAQLQRP